MKILLNNRTEEFDRPQLSVTELLELKKFTFKLIIIKVNGRIIRSEDYPNTFIMDGDDVHAIHMISGG